MNGKLDSNLDAVFTALEAESQKQRRPPVHLWHPERVGEIDIVVQRDGTWIHEGGAFKRPALVRLLASVMRREQDDYFLVTPHEKLRITVEDVPFLTLDFESRGEGPSQEVLFIVNSGDRVVVDASHRVWVEDERPYLEVRDGLHALINRSAFYRLAALTSERDGSWGLVSRGAFHALADC